MEQVRRPAVEVFELRLRVTGKSKDFLQMSRPLCWPRELGEGWAGVALYLGRIYLMIYDSCPFGVSQADFFCDRGCADGCDEVVAKGRARRQFDISKKE
ncbi:MAG: hypothetical protein IJD72_06435 [Alistipes sp.]|nr:hypothetical protein [Alistipes sp.]